MWRLLTMCCGLCWWQGCEFARFVYLDRNFGGIFMFGAVGFIIGPIICALFVTVWEIYGVVYKDVLESQESTES
ncbi:hypothetical protein [Rubritalea tangerina]|uniref:hypothetical protein n=1 Tax=Rubritalea tangerina TaxID=430798 RepID=UPI003612D914